MAIVDPNKTGEGFRSCGKGDKVLALVGFDKRRNQKQNWQYEVHWVCLEDLAARDGDKGDQGADHWDRFVLVEQSLFRLGQVMKAAGHTTPFDSEDARMIADVLANCYVIATVQMRTYDGEDRPDTKSWRAYTGAEKPEWAEIIKKGEENHRKLVASRSRGAGGSGSGSGSGGGAPQRRRVEAQEGEEFVPGADDGDVLF